MHASVCALRRYRLGQKGPQSYPIKNDRLGQYFLFCGVERRQNQDGFNDANRHSIHCPAFGKPTIVPSERNTKHRCDNEACDAVFGFEAREMVNRTTGEKVM